MTPKLTPSLARDRLCLENSAKTICAAPLIRRPGRCKAEVPEGAIPGSGSSDETDRYMRASNRTKMAWSGMEKSKQTLGAEKAWKRERQTEQKTQLI